jgi:hypothetical protein
MKVLCVDNKPGDKFSMRNLPITIGKYYDLIRIKNSGSYVVKDDQGIEHEFLRRRFRTIQEIRDYKLNELGI